MPGLRQQVEGEDEPDLDSSSDSGSAVAPQQMEREDTLVMSTGVLVKWKSLEGTGTQGVW